MSAAAGKYSQAVISREEELATIGLRANNDPSEGSFATFTDILCNCGRINLGATAAVGMMCYNKDIYRCHQELVSGQKGKGTKESLKIRTFHKLPVELQNSLLAACKKGVKKAQKDFNAQVEHQQEAHTKR